MYTFTALVLILISIIVVLLGVIDGADLACASGGGIGV